MRLPREWELFLKDFLQLEEFYRKLDAFVRQFDSILPEPEKIFNVFHKVPPARVCCVLYGEDPYPRRESANGIAFWDAQITSWEDRTVGNSMKNILKALLVTHGLATYQTPIAHCRQIAREQGLRSPGALFEFWLSKGVLLINAALTFSSPQHKKKHTDFWLPFHQSLIEALNSQGASPFYILWGKKALRFEPWIARTIDRKDKILINGHPTYIHHFLDPGRPKFSPFTQIEKLTGFSWL